MKAWGSGEADDRSITDRDGKGGARSRRPASTSTRPGRRRRSRRRPCGGRTSTPTPRRRTGPAAGHRDRRCRCRRDGVGRCPRPGNAQRRPRHRHRRVPMTGGWLPVRCQGVECSSPFAWSSPAEPPRGRGQVEVDCRPPRSRALPSRSDRDGRRLRRCPKPSSGSSRAWPGICCKGLPRPQAVLFHASGLFTRSSLPRNTWSEPIHFKRGRASKKRGGTEDISAPRRASRIGSTSIRRPSR